MAGIFTVKDRRTDQDVDVYHVKETTINGVKRALFLVSNSREGTFSYFPSDLFLASAGTFEPVIPVNQVKITQDPITFPSNKTAEATAVITPDNATDPSLIWTIGDESVATVSGAGTNVTVTGVSTGYTTLKATATNGVTDEVRVNVTAPVVDVTSVDVLPASEVLTVGVLGSCTGIVSPNGATNKGILWSVSDTSILRITELAANICFFTGLNPGTSQIIATTVDGGHTASCNVTIEAAQVETTANVNNYEELVTAANNADIATINILNDIQLLDTINIGRTITINGNDHEVRWAAATANDGLIVSGDSSKVNQLTFHMTSNDGGWEGRYGLQIYDSTGVTITNITSTGEDGGILINGSEVTLEGTIDISGNEFGGIEVSKGSVAPNNSTFTVSAATFINTSETHNSPTIWVENGQGTVVGADTAGLTEFDNTEKGQTFYYVNAANVNE